MNIIELDRFMTKAARDAMLEDAAQRGVPAEGAKFDADNTLAEWRRAFSEQVKSWMDTATEEAACVTRQPAAVCRRWLMAYAPIAKSTVHLELV